MIVEVSGLRQERPLGAAILSQIFRVGETIIGVCRISSDDVFIIRLRIGIPLVAPCLSFSEQVSTGLLARLTEMVGRRELG